MITDALKLRDLELISSYQDVANIFDKLNYTIINEPLDIEQFTFSSTNYYAIKKAYLIASEQNSDLQVVLFELDYSTWVSSSIYLPCIESISKQISNRSSDFLVIATVGYKDLVFVKSSGKFDENYNFKVEVNTTVINLQEVDLSTLHFIKSLAITHNDLNLLNKQQEITLKNTNREVKKKHKLSTDTLGIYLKEIGRIPLLTWEQEIILSKYLQNFLNLENNKKNLNKTLGYKPNLEELAIHLNIDIKTLSKIYYQGISARKKLIEANLRLVVSVVKKYRSSDVDLLDLIQEGNLGLIKAVEKFEPTKGYRFSTYAYWWIRQAITRYQQKCSRIIRLPIHLWEYKQKVKKACQNLITKGETISINNIANYLEDSREELLQQIKHFQNILSLDQPVKSAEEDNSILINFIVDHSQDNILDYISDKDLASKIIDLLSEQEKKVIILRFGLDGKDEKSLQQIGNIIGVTRERVRQIQVKAFDKIEKLMKNPQLFWQLEQEKKQIQEQEIKQQLLEKIKDDNLENLDNKMIKVKKAKVTKMTQQSATDQSSKSTNSDFFQLSLYY